MVLLILEVNNIGLSLDFSGSLLGIHLGKSGLPLLLGVMGLVVASITVFIIILDSCRPVGIGDSLVLLFPLVSWLLFKGFLYFYVRLV